MKTSWRACEKWIWWECGSHGRGGSGGRGRGGTPAALFPQLHPWRLLTRGCCLRADPRQGCGHGSGQAPGQAASVSMVSKARYVQEMRRHPTELSTVVLPSLSSLHPHGQRYQAQLSHTLTPSERHKHKTRGFSGHREDAAVLPLHPNTGTQPLCCPNTFFKACCLKLSR